MRIVFTSRAWADHTSWQDDRKMLRRVNRLILDAARDPVAGVGKPQPLAHNLSGFWSRRIIDEHRLVYRVVADDLIVVQVRYHY